MNIDKARVAALSLSVALGSLVAVRMTPAAAMSVNCKNAESTMSEAHSMLVERTPSTSGNVDKDFIAMEVALTKAQIAMARVEGACGKSDSNKQMAATAMEEAEARMRLFRNQGTSI